MGIKLFYTTLIITSVLAFASCSQHSSKTGLKPQTDQMDESEKIEYTCPEHVDIVHDKPGKCPICGRDLQTKNNFELFE